MHPQLVCENVRLSRRFWHNLSRLRLHALAGITGMLMATASSADPLSIPNTFVPGTPAKAEQVNQNFTATAAAVNTNDQRFARFLNSPAAGLLVSIGTTVVGKQISTIRGLAPLSFETSEFNSGFVAFNQKGLFVVIGTGAVGDGKQVDEVIGVDSTQPAEGSLLPLTVPFTGLNCTGTPFVSVSPPLARQGIVFGNPADFQRGYFARGELVQMQAQSFLVFAQPNSMIGRTVVNIFSSSAEAVEGTAICLDSSSGDFPPRTLLGVPVVPNDPQVTGIPNGLSGPISYTLTH